VARILIVGGGCRGRRLAQTLVGEGHAARITTRTDAGRAAIEAAGAECWVGTPDRMATLREALDGVTVLCWLLATAQGTAAELEALHGTRLEYLLTQAIDTTVRGVVYESGAAPATAPEAEGARRAEAIAERNAIPLRVLAADPAADDSWLEAARAAVASLLAVE
jgi:uncharacterized protein YbjT (DUF2867 family)